MSGLCRVPNGTRVSDKESFCFDTVMWEIAVSFKTWKQGFVLMGVKDTDGLAEVLQVPLDGPETVPQLVGTPVQFITAHLRWQTCLAHWFMCNNTSCPDVYDTNVLLCWFFCDERVEVVFSKWGEIQVVRTWRSETFWTNKQSSYVKILSASSDLFCLFKLFIRILQKCLIMKSVYGLNNFL